MRPRISITGSVLPSVRPLVRRLVGWSVTLSSQTREIDILDQIVKKNHVITSLCNNSISKRTHRWPYGPCFNELHLLFSKKILWEAASSTTLTHGKFLTNVSETSDLFLFTTQLKTRLSTRCKSLLVGQKIWLSTIRRADWLSFGTILCSDSCIRL